MSFEAINTAKQGLFASQAALDISGSNTTNAASKGYVRRVANFSSTTSYGTPGVSIQTQRMSDDYLNSRVWDKTSISNEWDTKSTYYGQIMNIVDEPTSYSLSAGLTDFFARFNDLAGDPSNITYRTAVLESATQFTDLLNNTYSNMEELQKKLDNQVRLEISTVNTLTKEIADLTSKIYEIEVSGGQAANFRDNLEMRLEELSKYGDTEITEKSYGKLVNGAEDSRITVMFGGVVLVNNFKSIEIEGASRIVKNSDVDADNLCDVKTVGGTALSLSTGSIKALVDVRDGDGTSDESWVKGTVYYMDKLNEFASTFAKAFNEGITDYNQDGIITADEKTNGYRDAYLFSSDKEATEPEGIRFFTIDGISTADFIGNIEDTEEATDTNDINALYDKITAKNISISSDLKNNTENLICSFTSPTYKTDSESIQQLIKFRENADIFGTGDVDSFIESLITSVGIDAERADSFSESYTAVLGEVTKQRAAYSEVSIDEEATYLIMYQQLYKACANVLNTSSEIYETLFSAI